MVGPKVAAPCRNGRASGSSVNKILGSWKLFADRGSMSLPRLSTTPRAALHSSRSQPALRSRRAWLRDTTVWLALGLSIATTMVVLARTTAGSPRIPTGLAITHGAHRASGASRPRITPSTLVGGRTRMPTPKRRSTAVTRPAATTTTVVSARPTPTTTTLPVVAGRLTGATTSPAISPLVAVVTEQWAGVLTYPDVVATSYSFDTTGGTVVVRTSLRRGAPRLSASLQCSDSPVVGTSHTDEMTMSAPPGRCTYNLQFTESAFESGAKAAYQITAQYPGLVPA
jgi:hypothetical protein